MQTYKDKHGSKHRSTLTILLVHNSEQVYKVIARYSLYLFLNSLVLF